MKALSWCKRPYFIIDRTIALGLQAILFLARVDGVEKVDG